MTLILVDLAGPQRVRFELDPPELSGNNDFPVARVITPPGRLVRSAGNTHVLRVGARDYCAADILADDCQGASVQLLLTLSVKFVGIAGWERMPGEEFFLGPCPKCWKKNDVPSPDVNEPIPCKHCGAQLVVYRDDQGSW